MTSVQGRGRPRRKRSSAALSVTAPDSFSLFELGDELSDQLAKPLGTKPSIANASTANSVPKYSEDDLQRIFKAVLEARAPVPTPVPVPAPAPAPVPAPTPVSALVPILTPAPIVAEVF